MASVFSKIVAGEIPCHKIAENEEFFAFLDISPLVEGHTLVIPKKETDYIFDLDDDVLGRLHIFSKKVAGAIEKAIPCKRIGVSVVGLEVPHVHIHLIPLNSPGDMNFGHGTLKPTQEELAKTVAKIRSKLA